MTNPRDYDVTVAIGNHSQMGIAMITKVSINLGEKLLTSTEVYNRDGRTLFEKQA